MTMRKQMLLRHLAALCCFFAWVPCRFFAQESHQYMAMRAPEEKNVQSLPYCSRERSRLAWRIIEEYLMPFIEEEGYNLSRTCRLHPENDMFREQEHHKIHLQANEWQCGFCNKIFVSERFLDQHFDNRHATMLDVSRSKCLADVCGALHCDTLDTGKSTKSKCNVAAVDKNRHLCESLANSCFPSKESPSARRLHDFFLRQFCDAHSCKKDKKPFPRGSGKKNNPLYYAVCILLIILLPLFYAAVYFHQSFYRGLEKNATCLKRISKTHTKSKPY
eukprot:TRINITY_DN28327_c0_g1_i1.p1 TRINITY_DN28327_c0_g1~~TRINITY_DN28327_c0_g1_i1.p1  ORF type:complete len:276 (-),score=37.05 TRINITY_DN28327_c0_g1_i1:475-1302(-)